MDCPVTRDDRLVRAREYYQTEGYVVLRGLVPPAQCDAVMAAFAREVRGTFTPMLRQKNMEYETNRFTAGGLLENPIFNVQDLQTDRFGGFKHAALDVVTHRAMAEASAFLLDTPRSKLVQTMFFEAPAGTWAHQDSYYQDSARVLGGAIAGWFALEDIADDAGRFYVCPRSHRTVPVLTNCGRINFADGHETYKQTVAALIRAGTLPVVAPVLGKGDVLLWNSLTIHGSFSAGRNAASRRSLTAHYLRDGDDMLQFHARIRHQRTVMWNGMRVGLLHDQDRAANQLIRHLAHRFPRSYRAARGAALKLLLATRRPHGRMPSA
jgi:phytanoyl-CoA hydroxylase